MELKNLKEYLEHKMQGEAHLKGKMRFKFAPAEADGRLMFYIRSKYKSQLDKQIYTQESAMFVYDKDGNFVVARDYSGDRAVSLDDIKGDLDGFRIPDEVFPSAILYTKGDLPQQKSIYLTKINVEKHLRGQGIASTFLNNFEKYAEVNEFEKIYGHGCAFGSTFPLRRTREEDAYISEIVKRNGLQGIFEDDKSLILFYAKKGYVVDRNISRWRNMCEYPFAFSKEVTKDKIILPNERLYLKDSKNKFDKDKILLM